MGNLNLADAAKAILVEGSKETFGSNISSKASGKDKPQKLNPAVAYGTKDAGDIGKVVNDVNDELPDYTKGVPTATAPGATAPVGSQPMTKLGHQPAQDTSGDAEKPAADMGSHQGSETSYENIRDRVKAKLAKQTMQPNPGAIAPYVPEETEYDDEMVAEAESEKGEGHEDAAQDKAMIKKMMKKEKMKEQMEQDVDALLSGENLSEEFKDKATTIFEAAVIARTQAVMEDIEQALFEEFEVAVEEIKEDLATKLDDYINYMAEEWLKENQLAVEKGLRAEIVESFIEGMKGLFEEHYIDIPEEKVDIVEGLTSKVEELEASLNEQIQTAVELKKELNESKKTEAIHAVCEGLTQTQVEKMKSLAEGVEFTTDEEFADKLVTLRESYFKEPIITSGSSALNEEVDIEDEKKSTKYVDPSIAQYAQTISKTLVK